MPTREFWALLIHEGSNLASNALRNRGVRPKTQRPSEAAPEIEPVEEELKVELPAVEAPTVPRTMKQVPERKQLREGKKANETPESAKSFEGQSEASYRAECLVKHFSTGLGVLKEAIDRSVDVGMGDKGTIQKIREAMSIINSAEPDVAAMLNLPEVKDYVDLFNSGLRNVRKAVFEAKLETGGGTEEDLRALHTWVGVLLGKAYRMSEEYPGTECLRIL